MAANGAGGTFSERRDALDICAYATVPPKERTVFLQNDPGTM